MFFSFGFQFGRMAESHATPEFVTMIWYDCDSVPPGLPFEQAKTGCITSLTRFVEQFRADNPASERELRIMRKLLGRLEQLREDRATERASSLGIQTV